jgi:hypothetical protein
VEEHFRDETVFGMTAAGGSVWSQERCPIWKRYCTDRYATTLRNRTMMAVVAVSAQVRDEFLASWALNPARLRTAAISDHGLIKWHPFGQVFVGIATYDELETNHYEVEYERGWWRTVPELQRFVARTGEPA